MSCWEITAIIEKVRRQPNWWPLFAQNGNICADIYFIGAEFYLLCQRSYMSIPHRKISRSAHIPPIFCDELFVE